MNDPHLMEEDGTCRYCGSAYPWEHSACPRRNPPPVKRRKAETRSQTDFGREVERRHALGILPITAREWAESLSQDRPSDQRDRDRSKLRANGSPELVPG